MTGNEQYETIHQYRKARKAQLDLNIKHLESLTYKGSHVRDDFVLEKSEFPPPDPNVRIFYFDIDNTLYKRSTNIQEQMQYSILLYLVHELNIPIKQARKLAMDYYKRYGLMVSGLLDNFNIDPMRYNWLVDDSLDLDNILKPDLELRKMLISIRSSGKIDKLWLFTNAYKNHALRCVKLLGIADLFDGITYCDYSNTRNFTQQIYCKPNKKYYEQAKLESGLGDWNNAWFIDDSLDNVRSAVDIGLKHCYHLVEIPEEDESHKSPKPEDRLFITINNILDLPKVAPEVFSL